MKETQDKEIMHRINNEVVSFGMAIASLVEGIHVKKEKESQEKITRRGKRRMQKLIIPVVQGQEKKATRSNRRLTKERMWINGIDQQYHSDPSNCIDSEIPSMMELVHLLFESKMTR